MDINDAIIILENEFKTNYEIEIDVDNNDLHCEIIILPDNDDVKLILQVRNYSCKKKMNKHLVNSNFKNIEDTLLYLNKIFNKEGYLIYSKMLDKIFDNEDKLINSNKTEIAKNIIVNNILECCVCNENNNVLTKCGHNLCRYCFSKMYKINECCENRNHNIDKICCPLCKSEIYNYY